MIYTLLYSIAIAVLAFIAGFCFSKITEPKVGIIVTDRDRSLVCTFENQEDVDKIFKHRHVRFEVRREK